MFRTKLPLISSLATLAGLTGWGFSAAAWPPAGRQPAPMERAWPAEDFLEGRWEVVELTRGDVAGKILPSEDVTGLVVFAGDKFRFTLESFQFSDPQASATFTLDPTQTPKAIDLTFTTGPNAGKTAKGIYEVGGEGMKMCVPATDPLDERPTDFGVPEGVARSLFILRKER